MHPAEYNRMRAVEDQHWWYAVLRGQVLRVLTERLGPGDRILDAGCGTGGMMERLRQAGRGWEVHGIDQSPAAVALCAGRGLANVTEGDVGRLPYEDAVFDAVLCLDVLYHTGVQPDPALREMMRVLRPGGVLVVNLPAFEVLRGSHDVAVCGARRYEACHVREWRQTHKLETEMIHYWNAWLFLPLLMRRQWSRRVRASSPAAAGSDAALPPQWLNKILAFGGKMDAWACRTFRLPFGTSLFAVAVKINQWKGRPRMSDAAPMTSFVVPLFNTGGSLPLLVEAFRHLEMEGGWELVLVDDGSSDGTGDRVREEMENLPGKVTLVEMARNFGEHAAVLEGYRHARGEFVVNLDDDLQNPVSEAVRLVQRLRSTNAEVVYSYYEEKQHHWLRNLGSQAANLVASWVLDKPRDLYLSSFRALRRELVQRIVAYRGPYPYVDGLILGATNRIDRLKVRHDPRSVGGSTYTPWKLLRLFSSMLFDFSIMPLRLAIALGCLLCLVGAVVLGEAVFERMHSDRPVVGWSSLMAGITVFSGAQLIMLGFIGEYVGRAFLTVSGKPQSLVRNVTILEPQHHDHYQHHRQKLCRPRSTAV